MVENRLREKSPCLYAIEKVYKEPEQLNKKAERAEALLTSTTTANGIEFDIDEKSIDRMDRVVDIANWKYNKAVAEGATPAQAYQAVYKDIIIPWKTADNQFVDIPVETICFVQEAALNNMNTIWATYG